jgi:2-methylcitrate dehydratase
MTVRSVLEALIKAYEIQGLFQAKNAFNRVGLDHTLLVKIASTAAVCYLLGLNEERTMAALSHAWADGHPLRVFRQAPNTSPRKGWAAGDACMRAVHIALLTQKGQPGMPTAISDPNWGFCKTLFGNNELVLPSQFGTSVIESIFFKLTAAEGHGISAVEAAIQLSNKLWQMNVHSPVSEISKISIRTQKPAMTIINKEGPLRNAADRDHCMQYMVAVAIAKRDWLEAQDYEDDSPWAKSEEISMLREKIEMVEDEQFTKDYYNPKKRSGSSGIQISLKDGRELEECVVEWPLGHPWREDTKDAVKAKLIKTLSTGLPQAKVDSILKVIEEDYFLDLPISDFLDLFWDGF